MNNTVQLCSSKLFRAVGQRLSYTRKIFLSLAKPSLFRANDRFVATYFLLLNDAQTGPFLITQLRSMWRSGSITLHTLYWQEGLSEWLPLSTIVDDLEAVPVAGALHAPFSSDVPTGAIDSERTLWRGHPSHWNYFASWFFGVLLLAVYGFGFLILLGIFWRRAGRCYVVTSRKVVLQTGLFVKSTNEVRIKDIRSINVTKRGLAGLMGLGSVEFSSAAADRAEIVFSGIPGADTVRDLVRKAQDAV